MVFFFFSFQVRSSRATSLEETCSSSGTPERVEQGVAELPKVLAL